MPAASMWVVAVAGDDRIALFKRHLHADHHRLLADVEVAKAADQAHAVHLAGLLLEAADQQHVTVGGEFLALVEIGDWALRLGVIRPVGRTLRSGRLLRLVLGDGHGSPRAGRRRSTAINSIAYILSW